MKIEAPHVYENAVIGSRDGLSPIFFIDINYNILKTRGKTVNRIPQIAKKKVFKGLRSDFNSSSTKLTALKDYFGYDGDKSQFKKVTDFELSKIEITGLTFRTCLGYGIK